MTALASPPPVRRARWASIQDAVNLFILERRAERRRPATIRDYEHNLGEFCDWLRDQDIDGDGVQDVTKAVVLAYRLHLQDRPRRDGRAGGLENATLLASQRCLRTFFGWAVDEGYTVDARILKLRKTRVPQKDATVFTVDQLRRILAAAPSPTEALAVRLIVGTGTRLSEAIGVCLRGPDGLPDLETDMLSRGHASLRIRWDAGAKGLKTRRTPVALPLMKAVRRYELRLRPHVDAPQLLINRCGRPYTPFGLNSVMDRIEKRVGFRVHAHAFRHTWATAMVQMGWSLEHVRAFIGHADYMTLHRYVRLATERDLGPAEQWEEFVALPPRP